MFTVFQKIKQLPASQDDDIVQQIDDLLAEDQAVVAKQEPVVAPPQREVKIPEKGLQDTSHYLEHLGTTSSTRTQKQCLKTS